jgi:DNA polymerase-3 subunit delta'
MGTTIPWHEEPWERIHRAWTAARMPHALLLEGPAGLGKLDFARRVAALVLGADQAAGGPRGDWQHPDLREITPPEGKRQIAVDQIRALCSELFMTAHSGGYKVALIHPADTMNTHAANSLLKTLEEPTDRTLLILVRARLDTLPATIASRCQRVRFAVPDERLALAWLAEHDGKRDWRRLLAIAGGAPLRALTLAAEGMEETDRTYRQDLTALLRGEESAVQVAARWQKQPLDVTLSWLANFVSGLILAGCRGDEEGAGDLQIFQQNIRLDSLFGYLDEVQAAIARAGTALSPQLVLEGLLIPWSHRLDDLSQGGRH